MAIIAFWYFLVKKDCDITPSRYGPLLIQNNLQNLAPKYSKGIHILETFDNGDQTIDYDGYNLIFDNKGDFPLFDLQGILLRPGELSILKITPTLFGITGTARKRFDYLERKCVSEEDGITFNITQFDISQYSESNCFMAAALEQTYKKCSYNNTQTSYLKCFIDDMEQIGRWKFDEVNVNVINKSDVLKNVVVEKSKAMFTKLFQVC